MTTDLATAAQALTDELVADRRYLHQHPELGFEEEQTARFVAERRRRLGVEIQTGVARTGVVGLIRGRAPGFTLAVKTAPGTAGRPLGWPRFPSPGLPDARLALVRLTQQSIFRRPLPSFPHRLARRSCEGFA